MALVPLLINVFQIYYLEHCEGVETSCFYLQDPDLLEIYLACEKNDWCISAFMSQLYVCPRFYFLLYFFTVVQIQLSPFSHHFPLPHSLPPPTLNPSPLWFCPWVLYECFLTTLSLLSPIIPLPPPKNDFGKTSSTQLHHYFYDGQIIPSPTTWNQWRLTVLFSYFNDVNLGENEDSGR